MPMDAHSRKSKVHLGRSSLTGIRDDSNSYLDALQREFRDQPEIYGQFVTTLKQWKENEISTAAVLQRVQELLAGHPVLIQGFNVFLPPGVTMDTSSESSPPPSTLPTLQSASTQVQAKAASVPAPSNKLYDMYTIIRFTERVLKRCGQDVYEDFVAILANYYHRSDADQEVTTRKLRALFSDDADLADQLLYIIGSNGDPMAM